MWPVLLLFSSVSALTCNNASYTYFSFSAPDVKIVSQKCTKNQTACLMSMSFGDVSLGCVDPHGDVASLCEHNDCTFDQSTLAGYERYMTGTCCCTTDNCNMEPPASVRILYPFFVLRKFTLQISIVTVFSLIAFGIGFVEEKISQKLRDKQKKREEATLAATQSNTEGAAKKTEDTRKSAKQSPTVDTKKSIDTKTK